VTVTELSSPFASCGPRFSTNVSVIFISSVVRNLRASGIVFKGIFSIGGRGGSTRERVASRCFCLSPATSCHVAPEEMVTVAVILKLVGPSHRPENVKVEERRRSLNEGVLFVFMYRSSIGEWGKMSCAAVCKRVKWG
jgi:hypothetical protein